MASFTPFSSLAGGVLIGMSASLLMAVHGRVAGISGIVGGLFRREPGEGPWRAFFVAGLVFGGLVLALGRPDVFGPVDVPLPLVILGGWLVGFGTRLGSGCTSGHGVCGVSRLSRRSLVATAVFMTTGMFAAVVLRHLVRFGVRP